MQPELTLIASDWHSEGPIALPDGSIVLVEIKAVVDPYPRWQSETIADESGGPNGAAIGPDDHCYVCNNGGFEWIECTAGYTRVSSRQAIPEAVSAGEPCYGLGDPVHTVTVSL